MATHWFQCDAATGEVSATRSGKEAPLPAETAEHYFVAADDSLMTQLRAAQQAMRDDARADRPVCSRAGVVSIPADTRPYFRLVGDKAEVEMVPPGATPTTANIVTLTATARNGDGSTNTALNGDRKLKVIWAGAERIVKFSFTLGVATKQVSFQQSGEILIESNPRFRLENPFLLDVVE